MRVARRIAGNFSWLAMGQLAYRLVHFALLAVLARSTTVSQYALVSLLLVYGTLWLPAYNFGLDTLGVREIAQRNISPTEFVARLIAAKVLLGAAAVAGMVGVGTALGYTRESWIPLVFLSAATVAIGLAEFFHVSFTALEEMRVTAALVVIERVLVAALAGAALALGLGGSGFAIGYAAGAVAAAALAAHVWRRRFGPIRPVWDRGATVWFLQASAPIALNMLFAGLYGRSGALILEQFSSDTSVASFNTALLILIALQMVVTTLMNAAFPAMSYTGRDERGRLQSVIGTALRVAMPGMIVVWPIGIAVLSAVALAVFGPKLEDLRHVMSVLLWVVPLFAANTLMLSFLRATGRQKVAAQLTAVGLFVNLSATVPLALVKGAMGVALAAVLTEFALFGVVIVALVRAEDLLPSRRLVAGLAASSLAAVGGAAHHVFQWHTLSLIVFATFPIFVLLITGGLTPAMIVRWRESIFSLR